MLDASKVVGGLLCTKKDYSKTSRPLFQPTPLLVIMEWEIRYIWQMALGSRRTFLN